MDILERLRVRNSPHGMFELCDKAAAEIERLRAILKDAAEYLTSAYSDEGTWWCAGAMEIVKFSDEQQARQEEK